MRLFLSVQHIQGIRLNDKDVKNSRWLSWGLFQKEWNPRINNFSRRVSVSFNSRWFTRPPPLVNDDIEWTGFIRGTTRVRYQPEEEVCSVQCDRDARVTFESSQRQSPSSSSCAFTSFSPLVHLQLSKSVRKFSNSLVQSHMIVVTGEWWRTSPFNHHPQPIVVRFCGWLGRGMNYFIIIIVCIGNGCLACGVADRKANETEYRCGLSCVCGHSLICVRNKFLELFCDNKYHSFSLSFPAAVPAPPPRFVVGLCKVNKQLAPTSIARDCGPNCKEQNWTLLLVGYQRVNTE